MAHTEPAAQPAATPSQQSKTSTKPAHNRVIAIIYIMIIGLVATIAAIGGGLTLLETQSSTSPSSGSSINSSLY